MVSTTGPPSIEFLQVPEEYNSSRRSSVTSWSNHGYPFRPHGSGASGDYKFSINSIGVMKVAPESKISTLSRPNSIEDSSLNSSKNRRFKFAKVDEEDHHGISIGGFYISTNCNTFLLVMAFIFILGGVILTVISYRPRDVNEDLERYKERQNSEDTSQVKIVGPICVTIGIFMLFFSVVFSTISWFLHKQEQPLNQYELSGQQVLHRVISVIDPPGAITISGALKRAPLAAIGITTTFKVQERSVKSADVDKNPSRQFQTASQRRRLSLSPNHVVNISPCQRNYIQRGISVVSSHQQAAFADQLPNISQNMEIIVTDEIDGEDLDDNFLYSSMGSNTLFMYPPSMRRDIACFPPSPSQQSLAARNDSGGGGGSDNGGGDLDIHIPNEISASTMASMRSSIRRKSSQSVVSNDAENPYPLLGELPKLS